MGEAMTSVTTGDPRRVVVLMGGPSEEHAISLKSGHGITEALSSRRWTVEPCVIPQALGLEASGEWVQTALRRMDPDVVFIALHGTFGEDGTVQRICEELGLAYTGSDASASRLGMDKWASRERFLEGDLVTPRGWRIPAGRVFDLGTTASDLQYPLVVKPSDQGSSIGISLVSHPDQLPQALTQAAGYSRWVLVEEFIAGRELTVGVIGNESLPVVEILPRSSFFDFAAKYTVGLTEYQVPARLDPNLAAVVQETALRAHGLIGCRHFSRTDLILNRENIPVVLEINTIPGFTPTSLLPKAAACVGISYDQLCERLVEMAWQTTHVPSPTVLWSPTG